MQQMPFPKELIFRIMSHSELFLAQDELLYQN